MTGYLFVDGVRMGLDDFKAGKARNAVKIDASGCTALTTTGDLPALKTLYASGCTALTTTGDLPALEYLYDRGMLVTNSDSLICVGPVGSRSAFLVAHRIPVITVHAGCFKGSLDEFASAVQKTHGTNQHGLDYAEIIGMIREMWGNGE